MNEPDSARSVPYLVNGSVFYPEPDISNYTQEGRASWSGRKPHRRRLTASGELFNAYGLTAAHKLLPYDTVVEVTHLKTGKTVQVRINDRGPDSESRIISLTYGAAKKLGITHSRSALVRIHVIKAPSPCVNPPCLKNHR